MAEGGALLRRYTGLNLYRGFESLSLRQLHSRSLILRNPPSFKAFQAVDCSALVFRMAHPVLTAWGAFHREGRYQYEAARQGLPIPQASSC